MKGLWYRSPAKEWEQALPLGNGRMGAMIYGGIAPFPILDYRHHLHINILQHSLEDFLYTDKIFLYLVLKYLVQMINN